jgi:3-hydroxyisobutyrate dehydrogenase and related beta-hydroxyacid dehydrogenases
VLIGEHGVLDGAHAGLVVVDMSTIDPIATRVAVRPTEGSGLHLARRSGQRAGRGGDRGTLSIMVAGPADAFERVRPILETMGRTIVRVGEAGAGQVAKACNQLFVGANIQADAFGHGGAGGSMHGAWPGQTVGFSYAMNRMHDGSSADVRAQELLIALYRSVMR